MIRLLTGLLASSFLIACASAPAPVAAPAPAMVIVADADVKVEEPPPHGKIGMSTAWRISDAVPVRSFEFRKRALHPGAAIGAHPINHDEIYYVLSGEGVVFSDGEEATLTEGMSAYLYTGAIVGIRPVGAEPLVLIIAYPPGKG
jgi:mannose-6-phosphate isomerase-like protein (cupin superfamily)